MPYFADLYLYIRVKRPRGHPCKNQVKILLWYYVIVERNTANTPFQVDNLFTAYSRGRLWCPNTGYGPRYTDTGNNRTLTTEYCTLVFLWPAWYALHSCNSFVQYHNGPCKSPSCKFCAERIFPQNTHGKGWRAALHKLQVYPLGIPMAWCQPNNACKSV